MAKIGFFSRNGEGFEGGIETISLRASLRLVPVPRPTGAILTPSHRVLAGNHDVGFALALAPRAGREVFRIELDAPEFTAPVVAELVETEAVGEFNLIWNRPGHALSERFR
jgi:uncharacterized protein (DUF736 family)